MCEIQSEGHRQILTKELEAVGLRLNKRPPQVCSFQGCLWNTQDSQQFSYVALGLI